MTMHLPQPPGMPQQGGKGGKSRGSANKRSSVASVQSDVPLKDRRKYLLDVEAVPIFDTLVTELIKRRPSKMMVIPVLKEILNSMDNQGSHAANEAVLLIDAAEAGDAALTTQLLDSGADVNAGDADRRTALHGAAEEGHLEVVELLVAHGGNVNARDKWGTQPLDAATKNQRNSVMTFLKSHGAIKGRSKSMHSNSTDGLLVCMRLCSAAGGGDLQAITTLLDSGKVSPIVEDYDFRTPLHLAAEAGHLECVKLLVSKGADPNAADRWGGTPTMGAKQHDHAEVAAFLVEKGGKLETSKVAVADGQQDKECLFDACQRGDLMIVRQLLDRGVDVNQKDYDMRHPIHLACEEGHSDIVMELIQRNANLNVTDRWGTTPLQGALYNSQNDVVSLLKDHGVDTSISLTAPVFDFTTRAMRFFDSTASVAGLPKGQVIPAAALVTRVDDEFGLRLDHHQVLTKEILALSIRFEKVEDKIGESKDVFLEYNRCLPATYPKQKIPLNLYIVAEDFVRILCGTGDEVPEDTFSVMRALVFDKMPVPSWTHFVRSVGAMFEEVLNNTENDGANAGYIPELKSANSDQFGLSICTVLGQECHFGDSEEKFSAQSTAKTFAYTMALQAHGAEHVHKFVGQEPSGRAFNDFALTRDKHPFNPVTNAGSIVTCAMVEPEKGGVEERMAHFRSFVSDLSGGMEVADCLSVYKSEQTCAFGNYALANFMRAENTFPPHVRTHTQLQEAVSFYLRVCSTEVDVKTLCRTASTYANSGTSPMSGKHIVNESEVRQTLQILYSCGMYDFSGEWACTIGMPAKSGVSGNIMIVVPGVLGMCVWSPKLDAIGNSVRGIRFAKLFSEKFRMSLLDTLLRGKCE